MYIFLMCHDSPETENQIDETFIRQFNILN